ncbi:Rrf2 family transcriptional regulator [Pseudomonas sp. EMN2]|uniref:Rrf2 family transcriptional regulator n=1 Tax=Pseudomonas sp. EMN2 TaxID=2615212 RepID=UPI00129B5068|nr:Rrf2 family transcriptional regulator [Pseudomonas sp. EMN2]
MTQQHELSNDSNSGEPAAVFFSHLFIDRLTEASNKAPYSVSVMLRLASHIQSDGTVTVSQAKVAAQCNITLKKVVKAIASLTEVGLISSVEMGSGPDSIITCWVSTELIRLDAPDSPCIQLPTPRPAD